MLAKAIVHNTPPCIRFPTCDILLEAIDFPEQTPDNRACSILEGTASGTNDHGD
jgi:hypothetical protein